jgi:amino acid permease
VINNILSSIINIAKTIFSDTAALIHLVKMNVGIGVMAMPTAFYNSGTVFGLIAMSVIAITTVHCMHLLVNYIWNEIIECHK